MGFKRRFFLFLIILGLSCHLFAQSRHFVLKKNFEKIEIPFTFANGLMLVKVHYNEHLFLWFILDTGAENTILVHKELATLMGVQFRREFTIIGSDLSTELTAYLTLGNTLEFGGLTIRNHPILVLDEDYFNFQERTGLEIHGIIGADVFKRFMVGINYRSKVLTLYNPERFSSPKGKYKRIPIDIIKNKPYINADVDIQKDTLSTVQKLLLDTGSATALLLQTNSDTSLALPGNVIKTPIAFGLGGNLEGYRGRIHELRLGSFQLANVTAIFQKLPEAYNGRSTHRDGIIGNEILSHFHILIDYINSALYLAPNRNFKDEFVYDKSGLTLASGKNESSVLVTYVVPNSPADKAGVKKGDIIKKINRLPVNFYGLGEIAAKLKKRNGKKIRLKVRRDGKAMVFVFRLQDLI